MGLIREAIDNREFLREFTLQQLRARYRGSVLGYLWALIVPLAMFTTLAFVFSAISRLDLKTFAPYFFAGYMPWIFFVNSSSMATAAIVGNSSLITRIKVVKSLFPLSVVLLNMVEFAGCAVATLLILAFVGAPFSAAMLFLPISASILIVFVAGICYLFASINVFLRDFGFIWTSVSILWFFCSPIFFPLSQLSPAHRKYFELNPFLPFLQLFQDPISKGVLPSVEAIAISTLFAVVLLFVGSTVFARSQKSFYAYL